MAEEGTDHQRQQLCEPGHGMLMVIHGRISWLTPSGVTTRSHTTAGSAGTTTACCTTRTAPTGHDPRARCCTTSPAGPPAALRQPVPAHRWSRSASPARAAACRSGRVRWWTAGYPTGAWAP